MSLSPLQQDRNYSKHKEAAITSRSHFGGAPTRGKRGPPSNCTGAPLALSLNAGSSRAWGPRPFHRMGPNESLGAPVALPSPKSCPSMEVLS